MTHQSFERDNVNKIKEDDAINRLNIFQTITPKIGD